MRLIDADALSEVIEDMGERFRKRFFVVTAKAYSEIPPIVNAMPTIDAVAVVHGRWDDSGRYQFPDGRKAIRCNICGCALSACEYHLLTWNYCPVCGAKMDRERKNDGK